MTEFITAGYHCLSALYFAETVSLVLKTMMGRESSAGLEGFGSVDVEVEDVGLGGGGMSEDSDGAIVVVVGGGGGGDVSANKSATSFDFSDEIFSSISRLVERTCAFISRASCSSGMTASISSISLS